MVPANNGEKILLKVAPGFAAYQQRTSREIPMVILHPLKEAA
jgi:hypothetical protein